MSHGMHVNGSTVHGGEQHGLPRTIGWQGAFWVASGVPALVLFSIGAIAATVGKPAWIIWIVSILFGFIQSFTYAEIAGLFPRKSGGAAVYGAVAWLPYAKFVAPLSVWCNWLAWTPVLSIGTGLAASYLISTLFPEGSSVHQWQIVLIDLAWIKEGLTMRVNATFVVGAALLLLVFAVQHRGILESARVTMVLAISALVPLTVIGIVPLLSGASQPGSLLPVYPLAYDSTGQVIDGMWNRHGILLMAAGLFLAAWSTYAFETAVCYTSEFRDPKRDTFKAIFFSGLLCVLIFTLVPLAFQASQGLGQLVVPAVRAADGAVTSPAVYSGLLSPGIYNGTGAGKAMAESIGAGPVLSRLVIAMLVLATLLAVMTSMAGASRTLYQGSIDGWLPRWLGSANVNGAPTSAMWTDLVFNLLLLLLSDPVFVLAASNVNYIIFNFLNLNAGWIHRMDRPEWARPYRAPNVLIFLGAVLSFVNVACLGLGADVWGRGTLASGVALALIIIPVFMYRHYVQDRGRFPTPAPNDLDAQVSSVRRAGAYPYVVLVAGVVVTTLCYWYAR